CLADAGCCFPNPNPCNNVSCGYVDNGCGQQIHCGCAPPQVCANNFCCTYQQPAAACGGRCTGTAPNCDQSVSCTPSLCSPGQICGGSGMCCAPNCGNQVCGSFDPCQGPCGPGSPCTIPTDCCTQPGGPRLTCAGGQCVGGPPPDSGIQDAGGFPG